jgi:DNA polymerase-1
MSKKHLFLIDSYGFLFRAYHSMPPLTRSDGTPVGAVLGFTNMLLKLQQRIHDSNNENEHISYYAAAIFDSGQKTFRNEIYNEYKANRPPAPDDLIPQFPLIKEATDAMNLEGCALVGYEADDLIATYAKKAEAAGMHVTIISSDKDLMQLINDNIEMYDAAKDRRITAKEVEEKFDVTPDKVLDLLSLMGDASDNVPGVPGIGAKTAAQLLQEYGDLETLLERAGEIKQNKRRESLIEFADQARLSKELITLCETVPLEKELEDLAIKEVDHEKLLTFLRAQDFKALITRYEKQSGITAPTAPMPSETPADTKRTPIKKIEIEENYTLIDDEKILSDWLKNVVGKLAIWLESEKDEIIGIAFAHSVGNACYVPLAGRAAIKQGTLDFLNEANDNVATGLTTEAVIGLLKEIIEKNSILKIGHDIKGLVRKLFPSPACGGDRGGEGSKQGLQNYELSGGDKNSVLHSPSLTSPASGRGDIITPIDDVQILSYILDGSKTKHELVSIAEQELDIHLIIPDDILPTKTKIKEIEPEKIAPFIARKADCIMRLHAIFKQRLFDEKMTTVYEKLERPLIPVLQRMEEVGVKVDETILRKMSGEFAKEI